MYDSISSTEFHNLNVSNNLNIIDVRDKYRYLLSHIPNAKNIPLNFLIMMPEQYLKKDNTYYIYCDYGNSSKKACQHLANLGYKVINLEGGYQQYKLG